MNETQTRFNKIDPKLMGTKGLALRPSVEVCSDKKQRGESSPCDARSVEFANFHWKLVPRYEPFLKLPISFEFSYH